jgi:hypothetical protein
VLRKGYIDAPLIQDISATWELTNINAGIQVANPKRMNDVSRAFGIYGRARAYIREKLEMAILAKTYGLEVALDPCSGQLGKAAHSGYS